MRDVRFRTAAGAMLSVASFLSLAGAGLAILWWLVFTPRFRYVLRSAVLIVTAALIGILAILLQIQGGSGISYGVRMGVVLLIAVWLFSAHEPGEFLAMGVWLLGTRCGFDLGLVAELGMQSFRELLVDLDRLRAAWAIKGETLSIARLQVMGFLLVTMALGRARDMAELLAVRGYRCGGSFCPAFGPNAIDILGCASALGILAVSLVSVGEFFILPW